MAKIPGPVLLIVGALVGAFSFRLNGKTINYNGPYALFLYIALVIALYGLVKTLIWYMMRLSKDEKKEIEKEGDLGKQKEQRQQTDVYDKQQTEDYDKERYRMIIHCKNCGLQHYVYANFCQHCGQRLK
ncbi:zinc ribbon domain-containing protein [Candidatus Woesearchaeota archaeon]|nr:zinc ribbon domain-containing protein [Candidatus Woesearchaeota archaeon]